MSGPCGRYLFVSSGQRSVSRPEKGIFLAHTVIDSRGDIWTKSVSASRAHDNKPEQRDEREYLEEPVQFDLFQTECLE
jgi:hypothetical protein